MSKTIRKTCPHCGKQYRSNTESSTCDDEDCKKRESEKYDYDYNPFIESDDGMSS